MGCNALNSGEKRNVAIDTTRSRRQVSFRHWIYLREDGASESPQAIRA